MGEMADYYMEQYYMEEALNDIGATPEYERGYVQQTLFGVGDEHYLLYGDTLHKWDGNEWRGTVMDKTMMALLGAITETTDTNNGREPQMAKIININKRDIEKVSHKYAESTILNIRLDKGNGIILPDRILIVGKSVEIATMKPEYKVILESNRELYTVTEEWIDSVLSHKYTTDQAPVYSKPIIVERYRAGWRYVSNFSENRAREVAGKISKFGYVKRVRICEAYDRDGDLIKKMSVWIMYNNPIHGDDGNVASDDPVFEVDIK